MKGPNTYAFKKNSDQLLGQIDLDTREWTNGVLTVAALEAVDEPVDIQSWIICDGKR